MTVPDPITTKILWDRLVSIVDQATVAHVRTAFSSIVREANDCAESILTPTGETLANSPYGLPSFVATQADTLRHLLKAEAVTDMHEGDVYITNDPYTGTGQAMDITLLKPIFYRRRLIAFAGSVAHSPELGGVQRWNRSQDVFEEALRIPVLRLYEQDRPNDTLIALIKANSRLPELTIGDLQAQLAALHVIETRLLEMLDEYHLDDLEPLRQEIFSRSEAAMRSAISTIPDGVYRAQTFSDRYGDDVAAQEPLTICATVTVHGEEMTIDYTGSAAETLGPFNSTRTFTKAYVCYLIRTILVPHLPNNGGFYRPLNVICPEGTVVAATFPSATLCRHMLGHQVGDPVMAALGPVIPERVVAPSGSAPTWNLLLLGTDWRGEPYYRFLCFNGGSGATYESDGVPVSFPANIGNTPIESIEALIPIVFERKEALADSGGPGRQRGGVGQRIQIRALKDLAYSAIGGRTKHPAIGLDGGFAGRCGRIVVDGELAGVASDGRLTAGGLLSLETPGGGGFGAPNERAQDAIARDMRDGWISVEHARAVWGIVPDDDDHEPSLPADHSESERFAGGVCTPKERN